MTTSPPVDVPFAAFDALPNPAVVMDLTAVLPALDRIRSSGVENLVRYLHVNPDVRAAMSALICGVNANRAALLAAGVASEDEWRTSLADTPPEPNPAIFELLLAAAWDRRERGALANSYTDASGRPRECLLHYATISSGEAPDWSRVIVTVTDLDPAGPMIAAQAEDRDLQADIFARANVLVWRARVRREQENFIWNFQLPSNSLASRLFHLIRSSDKGDLWDPGHAPEIEMMEQRSRNAMLTGAPGYQQEFPVVIDGTKTWLAEDVAIQRLNESEWSLVGAVSDVTARHEAEEAHRQGAAHLRNLLERADCMLWQARVTSINDVFHWDMDVPVSGLQRRIFGNTGPLSYTSATGASGATFFGVHQVPEAREKDARGVAALRNGAPGYRNEFRLITPQQTFWLQEQVTIMPVSPGVFELVGVILDITARRAAEEDSRRRSTQMGQLLERADCMLWQARVRREAGEYRWKFDLPASGLQSRLFGDASRTDRSGITIADVASIYGGFPVLEQDEMNVRSSKAFRSGLPGYEQEFRVQTPGLTYWLHEQVSITALGDGLWDVVGVVTDITARRTMEAALAAEKERLAVTLRAMSEGVVTTDTHGHVLFLNRAAAELIGRNAADAVGRPLTELCRLSDARTMAPYTLPLEQVLRDGALLDLPPQTVLTQTSGRKCVVAGRCVPVRDTSSAITGAVLVFGDVTERQRLDEQLQRASKLKSVGILAGGIAHDFNNILTAIMGNLSLTLLDVPENSTLHQNLVDAQEASLRARDLTQQLLTFAKGGDPVRTEVHLPELITGVTRFAMHGSSVGCEFALPADLWSLDADKGQVAQIVQNLVINAVQAMSGGGLLRIAACNEQVTVNTHRPIPSGDYVHFSVADTGTGIAAEDLARIFDPYFTTKQHGHGLGLATVYSIVRRHGGHIEVESEIDRGSIFHIWLPAVRERTTSKTSAPVSDFVLRGRVLFMDDEPPIRKLGETLLRRLGFDVHLASDGEEAVRRFQSARSSGQPFDLVVMDLTVPGGMGGREALERMRQVDPDVRAIVSSGYSSDPVLANHRAFGFCGMVAKPYEVEAFAHALREALGASLPTAG